MVLLDKMWDDVVWGPNPDKGLGKLRKQLAAKPLTTKDDAGESSSSSSKYQRSASMPAAPMIASPLAPGTPVLSPAPAWKPNVWSSVFDPGSNLNTRTLGANLFDTPQPNSPTVYDWLYSKETRSKHL
ncbi:auxin-repressed 12.5 kDa protein [Iris pallida]|uniref:Auxin-repressed 12.5 kDa protein n=1 Tax=Iris pallida TaxID=29817 RepID=A0AAX6FUH1_IRIPA|nr:auxin-repressed 12.5 kDa protein [Iris pallida]KAJ6819641.1 auxin-repressed 12.5 kDa protein [Iris pallida]